MNIIDLLANFNGKSPATLEAISASEIQLKCQLPSDYVAFLKRQNGGEGFIGNDNYLILWSVEELSPFNRDYEVSSYCPDLLLFGSNGGGEAYAFDRRDTAWRVVQVPFVGMDYSLCYEIGNSFSDFIETLFKTDINS
ncbi:MAG: SMI1/KNR4 family protein [Gemmataceae bacterium]